MIKNYSDVTRILVMGPNPDPTYFRLVGSGFHKKGPKQNATFPKMLQINVRALSRPERDHPKLERALPRPERAHPMSKRADPSPEMVHPRPKRAHPKPERAHPRPE